MTILIITFITILSFIFRYYREIEDELARGNRPNKSRLKLRPNEPINQGDLAKWTYPKEPYVKQWYHFGITPKHKERFPFSSTFFVFTTDDEHNYQGKQTLAIIIAITIASFIPFYFSLLSVILGLSAAQIAKELNKNIS